MFTPCTYHVSLKGTYDLFGRLEAVNFSSVCQYGCPQAYPSKKKGGGEIIGKSLTKEEEKRRRTKYCKSLKEEGEDNTEEGRQARRRKCITN